jgi:tetratricopeptide (TPR) repeat protein
MPRSFHEIHNVIDRIPESFTEVREGVQKAIDLTQMDPAMAITRVRLVLDHIVRQVFQARFQEPPGTRPLNELQQRLLREEKLPRRLYAHATAIREMGNTTTHNIAGTSEESWTANEAVQALNHLMPIVDWYIEQGFVEPTPETTPSSRQGAIPRPTSPPTSTQTPVPWKKPLVFGTGAIPLILLCAAFVADRFWRTTPVDMASLMQAYQRLEHGDWPGADASFQQLTKQPDTRAQSQGYAGLGALALARRDYQQALAFAGQAEALDPEIVYSHIVRGHLLVNQAKVPEAILEYRTATEKAHEAPWQQAIAHNHLGRIYAVQGDAPQALQHYDQAISRYRQLAVAYANKGHLLQQLGKPQEALLLYRQALQLNPEDRLTEALLRAAEQRERLAQDKQKQERIDQLVSDLIRLYQEGKSRESPGDGWTSLPLTMAFLTVQTQGTLPSRAGEEEFLFLRMAEGLRASGRIEIVERAILDKLLEELKLSASDLTDPQLAVRVGRILAARLIATGSFTRVGDEGRLGIRVIETETTRIKASTVEPVEPSRGIDGALERASRALLQQLHEAYPLQGRIAQVTPQGIIVNIGAEQGMASGRTLQVFGAEEPIEIEGKIVGYRGLPIGLIEVTNVEATLSQARVLEQTAPFQAGWKVQEVRRN